MNLVKDILQDPFKYAVGAIMVILAAGIVVRYGKYVWDDIVKD